MKKHNSWREEPYWHWDWPGRPGAMLQQGMGASNLSVTDPPHGTWTADLFVPDAESSSGWRQHFIYTDPPAPPQKPGMGFKK